MLVVLVGDGRRRMASSAAGPTERPRPARRSPALSRSPWSQALGIVRRAVADDDVAWAIVPVSLVAVGASLGASEPPSGPAGW